MAPAMIPLTAPRLNHATIQHGFYTRNGGVSSGIYTSLNCAPNSHDDSGNVEKNRQAILHDLNPQAIGLCGLSQIHSNIVHFLEKPWDSKYLPQGDPPKGDAIVTKQRNIALGILTADCAPVLFADPVNNIIGAAHAGWKGASTGILENTLDMMCDNGAQRDHIIAAIGPTITQENYEVGPEFLLNLTNQSKDYRVFFIPNPKDNHALFDLKGFVHHRLQNYGIQQIAAIAHDTYSDQDNFFSARRSTHDQEKDYGRQLSVITLL